MPLIEAAGRDMHIKITSYFLLVSVMTINTKGYSEEFKQQVQPEMFIRQGSCLAEDKIECQSLIDKIYQLWAELPKFQADKEVQALSPYKNAEMDSLLLKLNHALEIYHHLLGKGDPQQVEYTSREQIDSKYLQLMKMSHTYTRNHFSGSTNLEQDSTRSLNPQVIYHPLEMQAVHEVFSRFGPLELSFHDISALDSPRWQTEGVETPWAGYWYPKYDQILHYSDASVTAKLDRIMDRLGHESKAQDFERNLLSGILPESWEGLCNAWSMASILVPEPKSTIYVQGEALEISDQKALLTKMHENSSVDLFGVRYNGDYSTDGTYQDLRPEAFHKLFQTILGNKKQAFIIDEAADAEVWQKPIYKVEWFIAPDPDVADAYRVNAKAWKIEPRWSVSNLLTSRTDIGYHDYEYRLYIDPEFLRQNNRLVVIAGEWLGTSRRNHPDYIVIPSYDSQPRSFNPSINQNMEALQSILRGEVSP
ncbi:MAG: hypothetical protein ACOH5I_12300 [Oligoflexus sp.]